MPTVSTMKEKLDSLLIPYGLKTWLLELQRERKQQAATHICIFTVLTTCVNHSKCSTACSQLKYLVEDGTLYYNN